MIQLSVVKFPKGTWGVWLDVFARMAKITTTEPGTGWEVL